MSMNKFMHPRNIYRTPPDFNQLAIEFDEIRKVSKINIKGKVYIDFSDENAVRALTQSLLRRDFNLEVDLPAAKLIPTLPLRLNYVLWIEDIVRALQFERVAGVDIGCGASCIYPLLAVSRNPDWKMYGTEVDAVSIEVAQSNIDKNRLNDRISILRADTAIHDPFAILMDHHVLSSADFTMCNPPFFSEADTEDDARGRNRTGRRKMSRHAKTGTENELFTAGGEVAYVKQMIESSRQLGDRIKVFTTMLGHKTSLLAVQKQIKAQNIQNFACTEFCQGKTTRWGIAWTFREDLLLRTVPSCCSSQRKNAFKFRLRDDLTIEGAFEKLRSTLAELDGTEVSAITKTDDEIEFHFIAETNSWSNQRRKRRAAKRLADNQDLAPKRTKIDEHITIATNTNDKSSVYLHLIFRLYKSDDGNSINLLVEYVIGVGDIDSTNQLIQFIRNQCGIIL